MAWYLTNSTANRFGAVRRALDKVDASSSTILTLGTTPTARVFIFPVPPGGWVVPAVQEMTARSTSDVQRTSMVPTPSTPDTLWDKINTEVEPDYLTTYISSTSGVVSSFYCGFDFSFIPASSAIFEITIQATVRQSGSTTTRNLYPRLRIAGQDYSIAGMPGLSSSAGWVERTVLMRDNPRTSAPWTRADLIGTSLNALEGYGFQVFAMSDVHEWSRLSILVKHSPPGISGVQTTSVPSYDPYQPIVINLSSEIDIPVLSGGGVAVGIDSEYAHDLSTLNYFFSPAVTEDTVMSAGAHTLNVLAGDPDGFGNISIYLGNSQAVLSDSILVETASPAAEGAGITSSHGLGHSHAVFTAHGSNITHGEVSAASIISIQAEGETFSDGICYAYVQGSHYGMTVSSGSGSVIVYTALYRKTDNVLIRSSLGEGDGLIFEGVVRFSGQVVELVVLSNSDELAAFSIRSVNSNGYLKFSTSEAGPFSEHLTLFENVYPGQPVSLFAKAEVPEGAIYGDQSVLTEVRYGKVQ